MSEHQAYSLLLLAVGAAVAPVVSRRLGIPAAVGEILFGLLAGSLVPASLNLSSFVGFLAHFGFLLLMFLAGLEVNVQQLIAERRGGLVRLLPFALFVPAVGVAAALKLGQPMLLGLIVGAISIGVALPVLQELRVLRAPLGQTILVVGGLGELCTIMGLALLGHLGAGASALVIVEELVKVVAIFGVAGVVLTALRELLWWFPERWEAVLAGDDTSELGVRAALALMVAFAAVAVLVGVPDILATFLAGLTVAAVFPGRHQLVAKLGTAGFGFFIPIFFINVGWNVDLRAFLDPATLRTLGVLSLATLAIRILGLPALLLRLNVADAVRAATLLATPLTLQVAIAEYGIQQHLLPTSIRPAVVATASLAAILYPILARRTLFRSAPAGKAASLQATPSIAGEGMAGR